MEEQEVVFETPDAPARESVSLTAKELEEFRQF